MRKITVLCILDSKRKDKANQSLPQLAGYLPATVCVARLATAIKKGATAEQHSVCRYWLHCHMPRNCQIGLLS